MAQTPQIRHGVDLFPSAGVQRCGGEGAFRALAKVVQLLSELVIPEIMALRLRPRTVAFLLRRRRSVSDFFLQLRGKEGHIGIGIFQRQFQEFFISKHQRASNSTCVLLSDGSPSLLPRPHHLICALGVLRHEREDGSCRSADKRQETRKEEEPLSLSLLFSLSRWWWSSHALLFFYSCCRPRRPPVRIPVWYKYM